MNLNFEEKPEYVKYTLDSTCRTCCSVNASEVPFLCLFDDGMAESCAGQEIRDEIHFFNLTIAKDDGLPQRICPSCTFTFQTLSHFRKRCKDAQMKLLFHFRKSIQIMENYNTTTASAETKEAFSGTSQLESEVTINDHEKTRFHEKEGNVSPSVESNEENLSEEFPTPDDMTPAEALCNIKTEITTEEENFMQFNRKPLCANCGQEFQNYDELSTHFQACITHSTESAQASQFDGFMAQFTAFPCKSCHIDFDNEIEFAKHLQDHAKGSTFTCNKCSRIFNCARSLTKHYQRMHEQSDHECEICHKKFNNEYRFKYHLRIHDPSKLFHCNICGKSFMAVHHLRAHDLMHKDIRPFPCDLCDKKYRDKRSLETHMRKHSGERPFKCYVCAKTFAIRTSYVLHVRKHEHAIKEMKDQGIDLKLDTDQLSKLQVYPYKCSICSQGFKVAFSLASHIKTHFENRQIECKECGKTFKKMANLRSHMKLVHLKIKNFTCNFCGKEFTFSDELKSHKRVHTDEKPFKCETCGKSFKRKNGYIAHERIHSGDVYTCEICGKSCKAHSRLADHIMTHTSEERLEVQRQIEEAAFKAMNM